MNYWLYTTMSLDMFNWVSSLGCLKELRISILFLKRNRSLPLKRENTKNSYNKYFFLSILLSNREDLKPPFNSGTILVGKSKVGVEFLSI